MDYKINRTLNGASVLIDDKKQLSPLADYLTEKTVWKAIEVRYHYGTDTGIIILHCDGVFESQTIDELTEAVKKYILYEML